MKTVPLPPLVTRSRPWSKNWPKNVNQELNGADRPASGATFWMKNVWNGVRGAEMPSIQDSDRPLPPGRDRRRVAGGLVDDQVADGARLRVDDRAAGLCVRRCRPP